MIIHVKKPPFKLQQAASPPKPHPLEHLQPLGQRRFAATSCKATSRPARQRAMAKAEDLITENAKNPNNPLKLG